LNIMQGFMSAAKYLPEPKQQYRIEEEDM